MKLAKILCAVLMALTMIALTSCGGEKGSVPYIGDNGNWWIDSVDLGYKAQGEQGEKGDPGPQGEQGLPGEDGEDGEDGARGPAGPQGPAGEKGETGAKGEKGDRGATGSKGLDGVTPHIGANGNWWIGSRDTGVYAGGIYNGNNSGDNGGNAGGDQGESSGGASENFSDGLVFSFETMGGKAGAIVTGYTGSDRSVIIPDFFVSVPVIGMRSGAFQNNTQITSVKLSANMISLPEAAFQNCTRLSEVDFNGAKITYIPENAFKNTAIKKIILPEGIKTLDASAFSTITNAFVYIPASVTHMSDSIPESVYLAFESQTLPIGMESLANGQKNHRYSLEVPRNSVVYDASMDMYLCYEAGAYSILSYTPSSGGILSLPARYNSIPIRRIRSHAVVCSSRVTDLVIGELTESLDASAITLDADIRSIYVPASVMRAVKGAVVGNSEMYLFGASSLPNGFSSAFGIDFADAGVLCAVAPGTLGQSADYLYIAHAQSITLLRFLGNTDTLHIPSSIEGKRVTCIKTGFFEGYYTRKITIPASVVTVERHAFSFVAYYGAPNAPQYYSAEIYFEVLDPIYNDCNYDFDFIRIDPTDTTPKAVYFGGETVKQVYEGYSKNVSLPLA